MYMSLRMQTRSYGVYRQGLAEVLHLYNKVERKTTLNPCPAIVMRFGRDYHNQISPQSLKLSNQVNARRFFSNGSKYNTKSQSSPPNWWLEFPSWGGWIMGTTMSLVLSFWNNKRIQKLKRIEGEAELVVEGVEAVAEMVEKVAIATDEMAKEIAEKLPEESKLRQVALVVEHISEVAAHEAHLAQDFLHKVEEVQQDLDDMEEMIEPLVDKNVKNAETKQPKKEEKEEEEEANSK